MKRYIPIILLYALFSACSKEAGEVAPVTVGQTFYINENSPSGSFVGKLPAMQKDRKGLIYSILSGNTNNAFSIDSLSGVIRVKNAEVLNFEYIPSFQLEVKVTTADNASMNDVAIVNIYQKNIGMPLNGLVSYFPFKGNLRDSISKKHGTGYLTGFFTDRAGWRNEVVDLMGFDSYIVLDSIYDFPQRTISFWFSASYIGTEQGVILSISNPNLVNGSLVFNVENNNKLVLNVGDATVDTSILTNEWHHVVMVQDNKSISYYFDSNLISTKTMNDLKLPLSGYAKALLGVDSRLGTVSYFDLNYFAGQIDDLLIYNRTLTADEIKILYIESNLSDN